LFFFPSLFFFFPSPFSEAIQAKLAELVVFLPYANISFASMAVASDAGSSPRRVLPRPLQLDCYATERNMLAATNAPKPTMPTKRNASAYLCPGLGSCRLLHDQTTAATFLAFAFLGLFSFVFV